MNISFGAKSKESESEMHPAMKVQLSRLFGENSKIANTIPETSAQWRRTLRAVLKELNRYVEANVDTDEVHRLMLILTFHQAEESLKEDDFWPGYVEAITRLSLLLMGDYPDHTRRKPGRKDEDHYKLARNRTIGWSQSPQQRKLTLYSAMRFNHFLKLSGDTLDRLREFRALYGYRANDLAFVEWFRTTYPQDYAKVFR